MEDEKTIDKNMERREYMRDYMRNRYNADKETSRKYKNSMKIKAKLNLPNEEFKEYGVHLAEVVKLRQLMDNLPKEIVSKVIASIAV